MHQSVLPQLIQMHDYTGTSNVGNHLVWLNTYQGDKGGGPFSMKMPNAFFNGLPDGGKPCVRPPTFWASPQSR
jgi:hypothetical protein